MTATTSAPSNPRPLPTTIPEYLAQLRQALAGADPAMIQDALYDAEEYLRSELAEQSGRSEAEVIAAVAGSYGAPEEVADIYRQTEVTVNRALRPPQPPKRRSLLGRFFGVAADPYTYGSLFYMLLALATGIFYFTWAVTGASLSLVEGRIVEVLLGVRMPRRPLYTQRGKTWLARIGEMFTDLRTWSAMLYLLLMMPLGIAYFTLVVTLVSVSLGLIVSPLSLVFPAWEVMGFAEGWSVTHDAPWLLPLLSVAGVLLLFATLHLARLVGRFHGWLAKQLLVRDPVV